MRRIMMIIWTDSIAARESDKEYRYCLASSRGRTYGDGTAHGTFNRVTMEAILAGLERIQENAEVHIYTENRFVLNLAAHHLSQWEQNGYVTSKGKPVANADLWEKISKKKRSFKLIGFVTKPQHREWLKEATEECS